MSYRDTLRADLDRDEGTRAKPYRDTVGKLSIGRGRNLDDVGLRPDEIEYLFKNDVAQAVKTARAFFSGFNRLTPNRKAVLCNMAFNLGSRMEGFKRLRAALTAKNYETAAAEMMASTWAKQVGLRAVRLSQLMKKG